MAFGIKGVVAEVEKVTAIAQSAGHDVGDAVVAMGRIEAAFTAVMLVVTDIRDLLKGQAAGPAVPAGHSIVPNSLVAGITLVPTAPGAIALPASEPVAVIPLTPEVAASSGGSGLLGGVLGTVESLMSGATQVLKDAIPKVPGT